MREFRISVNPGITSHHRTNNLCSALGSSPSNMTICILLHQPFNNACIVFDYATFSLLEYLLPPNEDAVSDGEE